MQVPDCRVVRITIKEKTRVILEPSGGPIAGQTQPSKIFTYTDWCVQFWMPPFKKSSIVTRLWKTLKIYSANIY